MDIEISRGTVAQKGKPASVHLLLLGDKGEVTTPHD